jgi:hypothetical protein
VPPADATNGYRLMSNLADTFVEVGGSDDSSAPMVFIPGGTFRMGSDQHYPEEAPAGVERKSDFEGGRSVDDPNSDINRVNCPAGVHPFPTRKEVSEPATSAQIQSTRCASVNAPLRSLSNASNREISSETLQTDV